MVIGVAGQPAERRAKKALSWNVIIIIIIIDPGTQFTGMKKFTLCNTKKYYCYNYYYKRGRCLQCFDAVGWAAGRASGL